MLHLAGWRLAKAHNSPPANPKSAKLLMSRPFQNRPVSEVALVFIRNETQFITFGELDNRVGKGKACCNIFFLHVLLLSVIWRLLVERHPHLKS